MIREHRTLSVKDQALTEAELAMLSELSMDPRYQVLLDVMERACIEQETALINCPVEQPERILGEHAVSQAAWKFFTYIQRQVQNAHIHRTGIQAEPEPLSETERILGPFEA